MSLPNRSTKLKVAFGYILLTALLFIPKNCDNTMLFTNIAVININIYSIFLLFTGYAFFSLFTIAMR